MQTLIHADIFFFITTIIVVIFAVLGIIMAVYFIKILKNFKDMSNTLKRHVDHASEHIEELCDTIENNILYRFIFGRKRSSKKHSRKD